MIVVKIDDHVVQALARLMQQYKGQPNFRDLLTVLVQQIQDLENSVYGLNEGRQLYDGATYPAEGEQLDGIGEIVGVTRNGTVDAVYLLLILGKIASNFSDGSVPDLVNLINILFQPETLNVFQMYPAEINFQMAGIQLDPSLFDVAFPMIQLSVSAGVGFGFVVEFDETNALTLGDDFGVGDGGGLGSDTDPSAGGVIAGDIYTNAGA